MEEQQKRFYWLKLKRDFFKRHDTIVIESLPNGKDYLLFYLKLLCESVDHEGNLRFSDEIPYNEEMLASITRTNVDIVRSAIKLFTNLNMMEILDDGTYYMNKVNEMIGSAVDNDNANRQRRFRERQKQQALQESYESVTENNESIDIKSIDNNIINNININDKEIIKESSTPKKEKEPEHHFGNYGRIMLTTNEYNKLCDDFTKNYIDKVIDKLDEYVEMNNNKNKYKKFNLVIRKAIRENWSILNDIGKAPNNDKFKNYKFNEI